MDKKVFECRIKTTSLGSIENNSIKVRENDFVKNKLTLTVGFSESVFGAYALQFEEA